MIFFFFGGTMWREAIILRLSQTILESFQPRRLRSDARVLLDLPSKRTLIELFMA